MKSLFNSIDVTEIQDRIYKLTPQSKAVWGKMSVSQMLAHCRGPLQVASGQLKLKRGLIGFLFGGIAKKKLLAHKPFDQNLPTAPAFIVKDADPPFEDTRRALIEEINKFNQSGHTLTDKVHPFFGKLSVDEWDQLQWKHLDHHLRQFGV